MQKKVLIADNDQLLRALLREALESTGYQVSEAADGLEAWQKIQDESPDYLVLDLVMPKLDGARLCGYLKSDPRFRSLPIFVLTGTAPESARELEVLRAEAYIAKRSASETIENLLRAFQAFKRGERPVFTERIRGLDEHRPRQIVIELLAETAHLTAVLQNLGEGILILDLAGRILYASPAGAAIFQRSELGLLGVEFVTLVRDQAADSLRQALIALASQGSGATMRLDASYHDRTLHLTVTNLLERGQVVGHLLLIRDVTLYFQRIQELTTLNEIGALFTSTLQLDDVLQRVMERIQAYMQAEAGSLLLKDPEADTLVFRIAVGEHKKAVEGHRLKVGEGIAGWVFREGVPAIVPDAQQDPRFWSEMDKVTGFTTRSMLCAPLRASNNVIGVIQVMNSLSSRSFSEEDLKFLCAIAAQAAVAIENARLHEATVHQLTELRALHDVGLAIASSLTLNEQLDVLVERLGQAMGAQRVLVGLLDPGNTGGLCLSVAYDASKADPWFRRLTLLPPGHYPEIQKAIRTGRPLVIPEVAEEPLFASVRAELVRLDLRSLVIMPLMVQERPIGAISLGYVGQRRLFTDEEVSLLQAFAAQAAIAIEKAQLYEAIRQHAAELEARVQERTCELEATNEQLQEASRHKSEFLANMSHELRTPLNSIIGFAELLQGEGFGPLTERQTRYLGHIHDSGKHLLQLINDILDLSKVEAGKFVLQLQPLAVAQMLEDILVIAHGLANKKAQEIRADIAPRLPPLTADPVRFKQILFNLLSNAMKFTPEQGTITLVARSLGDQETLAPAVLSAPQLPSLPAGEWLELRVTDTGIGIKAEDLPRLFQEFVQLDASMSKPHEGSGLGLALTKKLVEVHGGHIWAASEGEGRGATFTVVLPFGGPGEPSGASAGPTSP